MCMLLLVIPSNVESDIERDGHGRSDDEYIEIWKKKI